MKYYGFTGVAEEQLCWLGNTSKESHKMCPLTLQIILVRRFIHGQEKQPGVVPLHAVLTLTLALDFIFHPANLLLGYGFGLGWAFFVLPPLPAPQVVLGERLCWRCSSVFPNLPGCAFLVSGE